MTEQRFVLDTNVTVSAAVLPKSVPRQAFNKALDLGSPLLSDSIVVELVEVLGRKRFDRYTSRDNRDRFLATLMERAVFPSIRDSFRVCRDPKDDKFLELAVAGKAACIITGDSDLLILDPFHEIPIMTPRRFLDEFVPPEGEPARNGPRSEAP